MICSSIALRVRCRESPVVVERTTPHSEIEYLHYHEADRYIDGKDLDGNIVRQLITGRYLAS